MRRIALREPVTLLLANADAHTIAHAVTDPDRS
jgi:hypothetical protein